MSIMTNVFDMDHDDPLASDNESDGAPGEWFAMNLHQLLAALLEERKRRLAAIRRAESAEAAAYDRLSEIESANEHIASLRRELNRRAEDIGALRKALEDAEARIVIERDRADNLAIDLHDSEALVRSFQSECESLRHDAQSANETSAALRRDVETFAQENINLRRRLASGA